jgi:hypothetical protein
VLSSRTPSKGHLSINLPQSSRRKKKRKVRVRASMGLRIFKIKDLQGHSLIIVRRHKRNIMMLLMARITNMKATVTSKTRKGY